LRDLRFVVKWLIAKLAGAKPVNVELPIMTPQFCAVACIRATFAMKP
jgi:hypothetical protein